MALLYHFLYQTFSCIFQAIGRLGGIVFQQECFSLKSSNLDSECYKDILLNIRHSQDEVSHTMANMVEALTKKTINMENILQDTVPQNIRGKEYILINKFIKLNL